MGLPIANGIEATSVLLLDNDSASYTTVDLSEGLTVVHGATVVTRTKVLDGVRAALAGVRPNEGEVGLHIRVSRDEQHFGFDSRLLARLSAAATAVADQAPIFDPDSEKATTDPWQEGLRLLIQWSHDIPDSDDDDYFCTLDSVIEALIVDLCEVASCRTDGLACDTPVDVVLVAAGTPQNPSWRAFGSTYHAAAANTVTASEGTLRNLHAIPDLQVETLLAESINRSAEMPWMSLGAISAVGAICSIAPADPFDDNVRTAELVQRSCTDLIEIANSHSVEASTELTNSVLDVSTSATGWLKQLTNSQMPLSFELRHPNEWPTLGLGEWLGTDDNGYQLPIRLLDPLMQRWASIAIQLATRQGLTGMQTILLVDDIESVLHPSDHSYAPDQLKLRSQQPWRDDTYISSMLVASNDPALIAATGASQQNVSTSRHVVSPPNQTQKTCGPIETYRSSPTAKQRNISAIPLGRSIWESKLAGRTSQVLVEHTTGQLRFTAIDPTTGDYLRTHEGPGPAVQDSVGNPPGTGRSGEYTCNGWKCLFDESGQRIDAVAPEYEGPVR